MPVSISLSGACRRVFHFSDNNNCRLRLHFVDICRRDSLSAFSEICLDDFSGPVLVHWFLLSVHLLHGLLLECLLQDHQILHLLLRDQGQGNCIQGSG